MTGTTAEIRNHKANELPFTPDDPTGEPEADGHDHICHRGVPLQQHAQCPDDSRDREHDDDDAREEADDADYEVKQHPACHRHDHHRDDGPAERT